MAHQQNKDEAPEKGEGADLESRFAELIRRFWQPPRPPASTGTDKAK